MTNKNNDVENTNGLQCNIWECNSPHDSESTSLLDLIMSVAQCAKNLSQGRMIVHASSKKLMRKIKEDREKYV